MTNGNHLTPGEREALRGHGGRVMFEPRLLWGVDRLDPGLTKTNKNKPWMGGREALCLWAGAFADRIRKPNF